MALWVEERRKLSGFGAAASGASFDGGAIEAFPLQPAGYPFLFSPDLLWRALPGEALGAWPWRKTEGDHLPDTVKALCRADPAGAANNCDRGWYMYPTNADTYMKNSANRAFASGKWWVHRTGHDISGSDTWSVSEASVIRGFILILNDWIAELDASMALLRSNARWAPAYGAAQIAKQEMLAAKGALDALQRASGKVASYDPRHDAILDVREAAAWYNGALDNVRAAQITIGAGGYAVDVDDVIEDTLGIEAELGDFLAQAADATLRGLYDSVRRQVVSLGEQIVAQVGLEISKQTLASITPFVQQFVVAVVGAYESLTREKPGYIKWQRGGLPYKRDHLNTYGHLMYRVMQQHRKRVAAVRAGYPLWTESPEAPPIGLRPESNRGVAVRTEAELRAIAETAFTECGGTTDFDCLTAVVQRQAPEMTTAKAQLLLYLMAGSPGGGARVDTEKLAVEERPGVASLVVPIAIAGVGGVALLWWLTK